MIPELKGYIVALMVPKGKAYHYLPEGATGPNARAICGARPKREWWVSPTQVFGDYCKLCEECRRQSERMVANRMASDDPSSASVLCAHCGKPSDRGFIQCCRACAGM